MATRIEVRPVTVSGASGDVSIAGGDTCLSDDSDATYVETNNLEIAGSFATVQFPGIQLPVGALSDYYFHARYEQVTGTTHGRPNLAWVPDTALNVSNQVFATSGDGVIEDDGEWSNGGPLPSHGNNEPTLFPLSALTPTSWLLRYDFDFEGPCNFRVYELTWVIEYVVPNLITPARQQYPPARSARAYPPIPNSESARSGSSAVL